MLLRALRVSVVNSFISQHTNTILWRDCGEAEEKEGGRGVMKGDLDNPVLELPANNRP